MPQIRLYEMQIQCYSPSLTRMHFKANCKDEPVLREGFDYAKLCSRFLAGLLLAAGLILSHLNQSSYITAPCLVLQQIFN